MPRIERVEDLGKDNDTEDRNLNDEVGIRREDPSNSEMEDARDNELVRGLEQNLLAHLHRKQRRNFLVRLAVQ